MFKLETLPSEKGENEETDASDYIAWRGDWIFSMDGAADVNHTLALSVVQVHAYPRDGKAFIGSGVVLDQNLVATNCHVTRHANAVVGKDALRFRAASQRADLKHEPCILDAPGMQLSAASLGTASGLSVGDPIYRYGYPRAIGIAFYFHAASTLADRPRSIAGAAWGPEVLKTAVSCRSLIAEGIP